MPEDLMDIGAVRTGDTTNSGNEQVNAFGHIIFLSNVTQSGI